MMEKSRELLEDYVRSGKLMQLATLRTDGAPELCNVWYDPHFRPDLLRFISRRDRNHSHNLRVNACVAGAIVAIHLEALGQTVRGVTFTGHARELAVVGIEKAIDSFVTRWPASSVALDLDVMASGEGLTRVYEVAIGEWVLFDEVNFPEQPRQVIKVQRNSGSSN